MLKASIPAIHAGSQGAAPPFGRERHCRAGSAKKSNSTTSVAMCAPSAEVLLGSAITGMGLSSTPIPALSH